MTIFSTLDGISSVKRLRRRFFINFMSEKLHSTDAVEMGIDNMWLPVYVDWGIMLSCHGE